MNSDKEVAKLLPVAHKPTEAASVALKAVQWMVVRRMIQLH